MKKPKSGTVIEIYPDCPKPEWMAVGAWCYCWGEGNDKFKVLTVGDKAAILVHYESGRAHGWESFTKLHRNTA